MQGSLWAVGFNAERLELTNSNPAPVLENMITKARGAANFCLSRTGSLVYVTSDLQGAADSTLVWVDRQGSPCLPLRLRPRCAKTMRPSCRSPGLLDFKPLVVLAAAARRAVLGCPVRS